jgi:hypothetical protein
MRAFVCWNARMTIQMRPVLECDGLEGFGLWPLADVDAGAGAGAYLPLSAGMDAREIGTAVAVLVRYLDADDECAEAAEALRGLLERDGWIAPGGLSVHDTESGITLTPGCCFGLESWREWLDVRDGEEIWLGHGPSAAIDHDSDQIRLRWRAGVESGTRSISFPRKALGPLLAGVQQDLVGFLTGLTDWAERYVPDLAHDLVARFDEEFAVRALIT